MKIKLAVQLSILLAGLVLVVFARHLAESGSYTKGFNVLFGIDTKNQLTWCADNVVDFNWVNENVPEKLKNMSPADLRSDFCTLKIEAISGIDTDKITWVKLAETNGATGIKTLLEWNPEFNVFRTGGMPFKSPRLSGELLDK